MGGPNGRHSGRNQADRDAESIRALDLASTGKQIWDIAKDLGVSVATAERRLRDGRQLVLADRVEDLRIQLALGYGRDLSLLEDQRLLARDPSEASRIISAQRAVRDSLARLLGLNVPPAELLAAIRKQGEQ